MSKINLRTIAAEMSRRLGPELFERGQELYKQGKVRWPQVFNNKIYGAVSDNRVYTVRLHLDNLDYSSCTCTRTGLCEHIAALLHHCRKLDLKTGRPLKSGSVAGEKKSPPVKPEQGAPVNSWRQYLDAAFKRITTEQKKLYRGYITDYNDEFIIVIKTFDNLIKEVSIHSENWPKTEKMLLRLHAALAFMINAEELSKDQVIDSYHRHQLDYIMNSFLQWLGEARTLDSQPHHEPYYKKIVQLVRKQLLTGDARVFDWLLIYRLTGLTIIKGFNWIQAEEDRLEKQIPDHPYYAAIGLASLKIITYRHKEALELVRGLPQRNSKDVLFFVEYLTNQEAWDELLPWLQLLAPDAGSAKPGEFRTLCECCTAAAMESSRTGEILSLLKSWLPRSLDHLSQYLIDTGQYKDWAEINMSYRGCTWEHMDKSLLRHLESREPAAMIPLYHQWAARLIEEKNRKAYAQAVKLLKKLRTLYNRQKAASEWRLFIQSLSSHYSRLRAFQEELQKGKLIS